MCVTTGRGQAVLSEINGPELIFQNRPDMACSHQTETITKKVQCGEGQQQRDGQMVFNRLLIVSL